MNEIKRILMKRDGVSEKEAEHIIDSTREEMMDAINSGDWDVVEDIMYSEIGLEMDYIFDLLD